MRKYREFLWMLPGMIGFLFFYVIPLIMTFFYAFVQSPFSFRFVGLSNIMQVIRNAYFQMAIKNTIIFMLISVSITLIASIIIAFLMFNASNNSQTPLILPMLIPVVAIIIVWNVIFSYEGKLSQFGVDERLSLYILFLWRNAGLISVFMLSAASQISKYSLEAAAIDGAGYLQRFMLIVIPQIYPAILFSMVFAIANSFKIFRESYLLYGLFPHESIFMVQNYIHRQFSSLNYPQVASAGLFYACIVIVLVAFAYQMERKYRETDIK